MSCCAGRRISPREEPPRGSGRPRRSPVFFDSRTLAALSEQQQKLGSDLPAGLASIAPRLQEAVRHTLHPDPAKRPASAAEAASMLQVVLLDTHATKRRVFQLAVQSLPVIAIFFLLSAMARGGSAAAAAVVVAVSALMIVMEFGRKVTLRGTIERGAGAGERITADVTCGFSTLSCRIVAEAFAAAPAAAGSSV